MPHLLHQREGKSRLEHWKVAVYASGVKELISFSDGLADDAVAIANACTEAWSNGMVEGFNHKLKWIKRSLYGQAGFPLSEPPRSAVPGGFETHLQRAEACICCPPKVQVALGRKPRLLPHERGG